ncbi:MAG: hypothetical protein E7021_04065 [Alphaproteobacteria bacterium]|nr:hypothetical protein [Alphaproteobacteria bacterium]
MKRKIITLCGSSKFKDEFLRLQKELTLAGNIVLSLPFFSHSDGLFDKMTEIEFQKLKNMLSEIHQQKIDMSDEIFVVNVNGYIGESTKQEIEYAKSQNKRIVYLVN